MPYFFSFVNAWRTEDEFGDKRRACAFAHQRFSRAVSRTGCIKSFVKGHDFIRRGERKNSKWMRAAAENTP
jgi:hypothetical protein